MTRQAVWILVLVIAVSLLAECSILFAQSSPAATTKSGSQGRAQTTQNSQSDDDKFNAAIVELNEKIRRDPGNPEPHYARAYLEHKASRVNDAQKSVLAARGLEQKRPIADWGRFMERYQGPSRVWLEKARRMPAEELLTPEPVVASAPKTATAAGSGRESQPTTTVPKTKATADAPKNAAPTLGFIGPLNDQQQLTMFAMRSAPAEEVITRDVLVNGKPITVTEKKPISIFHREAQPVPLSSVSIRNVGGERLTEEQIRQTITGETLVLMAPNPVDPRYLKILKPDTLIVTRIPGPPPARVQEVPRVPEVPAPAPAEQPKAQVPAPRTGGEIAVWSRRTRESSGFAGDSSHRNLTISATAMTDAFVLTNLATSSAKTREPLRQAQRRGSSIRPILTTFGDESFGRARVPILRADYQADSLIEGTPVAMLWDRGVFDPARSPIEAPPVMVFATELDEIGRLTTVGSVFEKIWRSVQEIQIGPDGQDVPVPFGFPLQDEQRKLKSVTHSVSAAKFVLLKAAALSKGGYGDSINFNEARRRIGNGAAVLLAYGDLPDPRYLSVFRDDTLLIVSPRHSVQLACNPAWFAATPLPTMAAPWIPPVEHLIRQLSEADPNVRTQAVFKLATMGPWAKAAAPDLAERLKDETCRTGALVALKKMGVSGIAAVPALRELLEHNDQAVRLEAADALCEIDRAVGKAAVPVALECLKSGQVYVRYRAAELLLRLAPEQAQKAVPVLLEQLTSTSGSGSFSAGTSFSSLDPSISKSLVPTLLEALTNPQPPQQAQPRAGAEAGPAPPAPVDATVTRQQDADQHKQQELQRRIGIAIVVGQFAPDQAQLVAPILLEALSSQSPMGDPKFAATAMLSLAPDFDTARDILLNDLRLQMSPFCAPLATALVGKESGDAAQAIALLHGDPADVAIARQMLLDKLRRDTPQKRYQTFSGWSECRLAGKEVLLPILKEFEQDDDEIIQAVAKSAVARIKSTPAAPRPTSARSRPAETATGVRTRVIRPITPSNVGPVPAPEVKEVPAPPAQQPAPAAKP